MKIIHPKNLSNDDLIDALINNLRRDPGKDVSIIVDELKCRLPKPTVLPSPQMGNVVKEFEESIKK